MTVLYRCAEWHALAKLRMHTEASLSLLNNASRQLSLTLWKFRDEITHAYHTFEFLRECVARQRRRRAEDASRSASGQSSRPKPKGLNLKTYKFHAIGDYIRTIMQFGTTDSYTTQIVRSTIFVFPPFFHFVIRVNLHIATSKYLTL